MKTVIAAALLSVMGSVAHAQVVNFPPVTIGGGLVNVQANDLVDISIDRTLSNNDVAVQVSAPIGVNACVIVENCDASTNSNSNVSFTGRRQ